MRLSPAFWRGFEIRSPLLIILTLACGMLIATDGWAQDQDVRSDPSRWSFKSGRTGRLDLSNVAGRISVAGHGSDDITIEAVKRVRNVSDAVAKELFSTVTIDVSDRAGRVVVRTMHRRPRLRVSTGVRVDYLVRVPRAVRVELQSVSGNIDVRDVDGETRIQSVSGDLQLANLRGLEHIHSVSGDIAVTDAASGRSLAINTVSGNVQVRNLKSDRVDVTTVSGNLTLTGMQAARLEVGTVSGDVRFGGELVRSGRYDLHSHSGNLELTLSTSGFDIEASTFSGTINSKFPIVLQPGEARGQRTRGRRDQTLRGVFEKGGAMLALRTFSGNITLLRR